MGRLTIGDPRLKDRSWSVGDDMRDYLSVPGYQTCLAFFRTNSEGHNHRCILAFRHTGPHVASAGGYVDAVEVL